MSLIVRDVIKRAARMIGSIATGDDPSDTELADAMTALNTMKRAMFGTLIGPRLAAQSLTGTAGQAENGGLYALPAVAFTLTAPLNPKSGARFGVMDANLAFATSNCTVARNGRLLEGAAANIVLNTSGAQRQWWYRGDTGNWVREADFVTANDAIEFPDPLIAYLPYMLAVVMSPEYGASQPGTDVAAGAVEGRLAFARAYGGRGANTYEPEIGLPQPAPAQG